MTSDNSTLALQVAQADDDSVVRLLADLDDSRPLEGDVLLALVDGEAVAAVSLGDGRVVANPFRRTADTVTLLSLRASQLGRRRARRRRAGVPLIPRLRAA
ncbi:MAG: hypothetical protein JO243_14680 [Solirubrobacterales bacterium]|nr:hypothetical protein [Solirubrobacterales bacterium]